MNERLTWVEEPERLTLAQRFRLIEIAHETPHAGLRAEVIRFLVLTSHPAVVVARGYEFHPDRADNIFPDHVSDIGP